METNATIIPAFYDSHEVTIDGKKRLLLPADYRRSIDTEKNGPALFIKPTSYKTLQIYPARTYELLGQQRPLSLAQTPEALRESIRHFALASKVELDKQGRILIPEKMLAQTGIGKGVEVVLAGLQDHLEIFTREAWKQTMEGL